MFLFIRRVIILMFIFKLGITDFYFVQSESGDRTDDSGYDDYVIETDDLKIILYLRKL